MHDQAYVGRFAPSPSGPLHFGSLVAALGSYLDARAHQGRWLVRIEDIDPPREVAGAADAILHTLEAFGLLWDGDLLYQHQRGAAYHEALERLRAAGQLYYCTCSRKQLAPYQGVYPGFCRERLAPPDQGVAAVRFNLSDDPLAFTDRLQGRYQALPKALGDPAVLRKDGLWAYQLAVVVDDAFQGVNQIVRGVDLLSSTPWQLALQEALGYRSPTYAHLPLIVNGQGQKLSKQNFAPALSTQQRLPLLAQALRVLGQPLPDRWQDARLDELLKWSVTHFSWEKIPRCTELIEPGLA